MSLVSRAELQDILYSLGESEIRGGGVRCDQARVGQPGWGVPSVHVFTYSQV